MVSELLSSYLGGQDCLGGTGNSRAQEEGLQKDMLPSGEERGPALPHRPHRGLSLSSAPHRPTLQKGSQGVLRGLPALAFLRVGGLGYV